jgi:ABC-type glycerol-3-phosphate transport system substrate-binding protein
MKKIEVLMLRSLVSMVLLVMSAGLFSCSLDSERKTTAILWTDRPEFAFYGEYFNAAQDVFKIEIRYFDSLAQKLATSPSHPDIVVGSWLKSASTRVFFKSLDGFFKRKNISKNTFYNRLLDMGRVDGRLYLLPVSFNAPALIFARDKGELLSSPFTVGFDEMKRLGKDYNIEKGGGYTRMGFSPLWDDDFLYITATLFNASFREAVPLAWDAAAIERAMGFIYDWTHEVNTNSQAEEDFFFKYFYDPSAKLILSGRILFSYMDSDDFFTLAEEQRNNLDFRWIAEDETIPLTEGSVYLGLPKKGRANGAAAAFVRWFFEIETQRQLLENSKNNRMHETSFGISGGFSALRPVTEYIFPQFYPGLLGHILPENVLSPANILPGHWAVLKERVILPYLRERARSASASGVYPLERRMADWQRINR